MDDSPMDGPGEDSRPDESSESAWPRRQVYFVTVEWLDEPHKPESPERLAQVLRYALEHSHAMEPGAPQARFVVRVKAGDIASEAEGKLEHHHHHQSG
jgi:hypothetical protein